MSTEEVEFRIFFVVSLLFDCIMSQFLNSTISGVSIDMNNSWASRSLQEALHLPESDIHRDYNYYQARFQQRQMQEKEEKLLRLYETQQQRAFEKVSRGSSGDSSISGGTSPVSLNATIGSGAGRVRQMFDERRQKAGIDRSYPLEPLKQTTRMNAHVAAKRVSSLDRNPTLSKNPTNRQSTTSMKNSFQRTVTQTTNNNPLKSRSIKQTSNAVYSNGKLLEENSTYDESHELKQQKKLEEMMNNHNLNDSLEDEEMPNLGIDEIDEVREILTPSPNENDNYVQKKSLNDRSVTNKIVNNNKTAPVAKRVTKTPVSTKSISPRTSPENKKRTSAPMKAMSTPKSGTNRVSAPVRAVSAPRSGRGPQSPVVNDNLSACKYCQRRFAPDRLMKHEEICARTQKKQRKVYDPVKHRVQGTEIESYVKKTPKGLVVKVTKAPQMPKTDWRRQHEEFISTIRAAKMAQAHVAAGGKLTDLPPPPPSLNPDYVQCPHCGRRFNEAAAERHIPKCATMLHNKPNRLSNGPPKRKF